MTRKKEENQRKALKELFKAVQYRNKKIFYLLDENRFLRQQNFELRCAVQALSKTSVTMHPYGGYTDPQLADILDKNDIDWRR